MIKNINSTNIIIVSNIEPRIWLGSKYLKLTKKSFYLYPKDFTYGGFSICLGKSNVLCEG